MLSLVLMVKDCATSRDFYTGSLGFGACGPTLPGPDGEVIFSAVSRDGVTILLDGTEPETASARDRGKGVALQLSLPYDADIDGLYDRLKRADVPITLEATDHSGGERMFAITDPDGYSITIARKLFAAGMNPSAA